MTSVKALPLKIKMDAMEINPEYLHDRGKRFDDREEQMSVEEILAREGISRNDIEKYESYSMFYRALQAVLKHQHPSQETVRRFAGIEKMLGEHIKDEMSWKDDVLNAIKDLTKNVTEMKPTVKKVSDIETFLSVGNRVGWIILLLIMAAIVGLYHFGKDIITGIK